MREKDKCGDPSDQAAKPSEAELAEKFAAWVCQELARTFEDVIELGANDAHYGGKTYQGFGLMGSPQRRRSTRRTKKATSIAVATINPNVGTASGPRWRNGSTMA